MTMMVMMMRKADEGSRHSREIRKGGGEEYGCANREVAGKAVEVSLPSKRILVSIECDKQAVSVRARVLILFRGVSDLSQFRSLDCTTPIGVLSYRP